MKNVKLFKAGFRPGSGNYGRIELIFQDGTSQILDGLSADKFNALYNILQNDPVYWNGIWLHTDTEFVTD